MNRAAAAGIAADGNGCVRVSGCWTLAGLSAAGAELEVMLGRYGKDTSLAWDLSGVDRLDSAGAITLWRSWDVRRPHV